MGTEGKVTYLLKWILCDESNQLAGKFYMEGYPYSLPFLLREEEADLPVSELQERHLLFGIFVALHAHYTASRKETPVFVPDILIAFLEIARQGFSEESLEKLILDVAFTFHNEGNGRLTMKVLEVGKILVENSSKILSDLITCYWELLQEEGASENWFEKILEIFEQVDLDDISTGGRELICYAGLCSTVFLQRGEVESFRRKYIYPYVSNTGLKKKMEYLLENYPDVELSDVTVEIR